MLFAMAENASPACLKRLEQEYALRDELHSTWAARPVHLSRDAGRVTMTLEDPGGEPLDRVLKGPTDPGIVLRIALGLARTLQHLHERGIIHKDIKPQNILVNVASGDTWLMGFGIASRATREQQSPEALEVIAGTLAYMAPEQTGRMNRSVDSRSDLYSFGIILYELLTGVLPYAASDPLEWVHCHIARLATPPAKRNPSVPAQLSAITMKLMAKTAEERYQTAGGVEADLRACLRQWQSSGSIDAFPLGMHDAAGRLVMPEKLYGREREIDQLLAAFDRVVTHGAAEFVLVSGYAGTGKSAIVNELHKALAPSRGLFAAGKFDQYKRDIPYATLGQAFQTLVRSLLAKNETDLKRWRSELQQTLGANAQLVINLVPELELVIGAQPAVTDLSAQDAKHRFQSVLQAFLSVFARKEHPLALFLDDLQWIDGATLELLEHLATQSQLRYLILIGAYRDNEMDATHPLVHARQIIRNSSVRLQEIVLTPLSIFDIQQLLVDCLRSEPARAASLAHLIHTKTAGNPFFAMQFIASLAEEGMLTFDRTPCRWAWDEDRIHAKGYSDNVADLMVAKLKRQPPASQKALQQLACLGSIVELDELAALYAGAVEQVHGDLREAVRAGLVLPSKRAYAFLHDRVQEAAYLSIPAEKRAAMHLRIGRGLLAGSSQAQIEENIFEIVSQLNRGSSLITERQERARVAELNLIAGKRAKASVAHAAALTYFSAGLAMLSNDDWERRYRLMFDLQLNRAQCEFLTGEVTAAEEHLDTLSAHAADLTDLAAVILIQVNLQTLQGQAERAVATCLGYLQRLGIVWSAHPSDAEIQEEYQHLRRLIGVEPVERFIDLPRMVDPQWLRVALILGALSVSANMLDTRLMDRVILRIAVTSLKHGICDESCVAFGHLGMILGPRFGDYRTGYRFGQLSIDLIDKLRLERFKARIYTSFATFVTPFVSHVREGYLLARRACDVGPHTHDITWSSFAWRSRVGFRLACGDPLEEVEAEAERSLAFARKAKFQLAVDMIVVQLRMIRMLRGRLPTFGTFNDHDFDEASFESRLIADPMPRHDGTKYLIEKVQARFHADDPAAGLEAAGWLATRPEGVMPSIEHAQLIFFAALSHAACFGAGSPEKSQQHLSAAKEHHDQLVLWAQDCPANFRNCASLVGAEVARIEGRVLDAESLYEDAICHAREQGFVQNEGVAQELAARFYSARGLETIANAYLLAARACYVRWGAEGKVRHFDRNYPHVSSLLETASRQRMDTQVEHLDLATVEKVSQTVSGEIQFDRLIEILMKTALEHAGAERGLLILPRGENMWIEAEATTTAEAFEVRRPRKLRVDASILPASVFHYVTRTRETVLLHDARQQEPFSADEYVRRRASRSILCLPLIKQTELMGVLYLENNLATHAFTPARIAALRVLASQAATSLENARLYTKLQTADAFLSEAQRLSRTGSFGWSPNENEMVFSTETFRILEQPADVEPSLQLLLQRVHPDDLQRVRDVLETASSGKRDFEMEHRLVMPDGSLRHVHVVAHATPDENVEPRFVGAVMDVTTFREAQDRLSKAQAELADVGRQAEFGEFASMIAHEIKQPLAAIVTNISTCQLSLAKDQPDRERLRSILDRIARNAHRAADVIRSIHARAKKSPSQMIRIDLNRLIEETLELLQSELQRRAVALEVRLSAAPAWVDGDPTQVQQVLVNLVTNAIEAIESGNCSARLVRLVSEHSLEGTVEIAVEDSGPGVDAAVLSRIFDPMFTTKPQGMGLGLAICRSIVESHGGQLWVSPNPRGGSVFRFTLPARTSGVP